MSSHATHKLNALIIGAINGILFGAFLELAWRSLYLYESNKSGREPLSFNLYIQMASYPFSWWHLPVLFLVVVALSSFLVHRYLSQYIQSPIWLWQIIGLVAVLGCSIFSLFSVWYQWQLRPVLSGVDIPWQSLRPDLVACLAFLPLILGFNVIFVYVLGRRRRRLL